MNQVVRSEQLPNCSRCGQDDLLTTADMPQKDAFGRPIHLELCRTCDADKPAAAALIEFFATGGGQDTSRTPEAARLLMEWTKEGMAAYGWYLAESPRGHG